MNVNRYLTSFKNLLTSSDYRFLFLAKYGFLDWMSDEKYLKKFFKITMGYDLDLSNPKTFNEKLQWLKLYNRKPLYTTLVDKYAVKDYVSNIIGEEYIIPTLGVWDNVEQIDFNTLPNQFVLKCTHDSHGIVICKDKTTFDLLKAKKTLEKALKQNYYMRFREWPYKDVKPRIIAEQYLEDKTILELRDYKFFCFDGECKCLKIDFDRFKEHHANYYDLQGNLMNDLGEVVCPPKEEKDIIFPSNLNVMIKLAEKLSTISPFLRVDFYNANGEIYFGELTFYPASGFGKFINESWDYKLGEWLKIPNKSD